MDKINLKILMVILIYYGIVISILLTGGSIVTGVSTNANINSSEMQDTEIDDTAGLFSSGISLGRFITLTTFGIGFGEGVPAGFKVAFGIWQSMFTIFCVGWAIDSIWSG